MNTAHVCWSCGSQLQLAPEQLHKLARLVAAELRGGPGRELVDAATLAELLGTSRDFVYENSSRLGAVRIGDGPRPRLRFDVETAKAAMAEGRRLPERAVPGRRSRREVSSRPNANAPAAQQRPGAGQRS